MTTLVNKKYFLIVLLGSALSVPAITTAAIGNNGVRTESISTSISDLDLSQQEGISTLYKRLQHGAIKVCGKKDDIVTGSRVEAAKIRRQFRTCYAKALGEAVQSVNLKPLTEMHEAST